MTDKVESAKYVYHRGTTDLYCIGAVINGQEKVVPFDPENTDYRLVMEAANNNLITIGEAEFVEI